MFYWFYYFNNIVICEKHTQTYNVKLKGSNRKCFKVEQKVFITVRLSSFSFITKCGMQDTTGVMTNAVINEEFK